MIAPHGIILEDVLLKPAMPLEEGCSTNNSLTTSGKGGRASWGNKGWANPQHSRPAIRGMGELPALPHRGLGRSRPEEYTSSPAGPS